MKRVAEKQFDDELAGLELRGETAKAGFVGVRRHAEGQLIAKFLGEFLFEAERGLIVELVVALSQAERSSQIFLRQSLHPDQQAALVICTTRPLVNTTVNLFPAAKIEIADAKVGAFRNEKRLLQRGEQIGFDVVEDSRHGCSLARESALFGDCPLWELWCLK